MTERITAEELAGLVSGLNRDRVILALDGPCASGKTTLAGEMGRKFGWSVVHMDDFFLRPEQRTPERYALPGGNVDHERFLAEVLEPLRTGLPVRYRPFDCRTMELSGPVELPPAQVTLVEGAYSCHPSLWDFYDLHLFLPVDPEVQRSRILLRNGDRAGSFFDQWIPLERAYFTAYDLPGRCDFLLEL